MNDKEYEKLKSRIKKYVDKWLIKLGLKGWDIDFYYHRDAKAEKDGNYGRGFCVEACTAAQYPYKSATVWFYLSSLFGKSDKDIENTVLHELIHILTDEMKDQDKDLNHCERVITDLTNAFLWTYKRVK